MLDLIRNNRRVMLIILVVLVIPAFVLLGGDRLGGGSNRADGLAEVGGNVITAAQLDNQVRQIQQSRPDLDASIFTNPEVKMGILSNIMRDQLWVTASYKNRLAVSDKAVREALKLDPYIQGMMDSSGNLDMNQYYAFLQNNGLNPKQFEDMTRARVMAERMQVPTAKSFTSQTDIDQFIQINSEKYIIRQQLFDANAYIDQVKISPEELQAYYQQNLSIFMLPARANIEYVIFDVDTFSKTITVNEADARTFFEQNKNAFVVPEERRASHILIEVQSSASAEQKEQARTKAQQILTEVKNDPTRFAELAKANSADPGSATQGGDLGYFPRGVMVEAFDQATFALKEGEIGDLIQTPFGYHIIMITGIKAADTTFEDQRSKVEAQLRQQLVNQQFSQAADKFTNDVNTNRTSFEGVAKEFGLTIQRAENLTPNPQPGQPGATGILADAKLLAAIFSPDASSTLQNIAPVQVGPTQLVAARVTSYTPETAKPYDAVKDQVKALASYGGAVALAQTAAQENLKKWQDTPEKANTATEYVFSRDEYSQWGRQGQPQRVDGAVVMKIFAYSNRSQFPQTFTVELPNKGTALVQVQGIEPADLASEFKREQAALVAASLHTNAQENAYLEFLETEYKAKVYPQTMERIIRSTNE